MIRFICFLFNKSYEPCKGCETLKQQLAYSQAEKKELLDTILGIIKPKTFEQPAQELLPIATTAGLFSRRRAALESRDRETAKIIRSSESLGKSDDLTKLEQELGVEEVK